MWKPDMQDATVVWYFLQNNGDGTGTPHFCESKEIAQIMEDVQDEGWGDSCVGSISLRANGPVHVEDILTPEYAVEDIYYRYMYNNDIFDDLYADDYFAWSHFWEEVLPAVFKLENLVP